MRKVIGSSPISSTIQIPLTAVSGTFFVYLCKSAGRQTFSVRRPAFFCLCRAEVAHQDDGDLRARGVLLRRKVVHPALARSGDQSRRVGPRQGVIGPAADGSAVREAAEEFSVTPKHVMYLGKIGAVKGCLPSSIFLCTEFDGIPECDHEEMEKAGWMSLQELHQEDLFPAFEESIKMLINLIAGG